MAKEKISRTEYDTMRSYLLKKKDTKINLDDYEVYEPVSHHSNDNEKIKRELKRKQNMKNTIRLTESELKRVISESVKRVLKEMDENNRVDFHTVVTDIKKAWRKLEREEGHPNPYYYYENYPTLAYYAGYDMSTLSEENQLIVYDAIKRVLEEYFD